MEYSCVLTLVEPKVGKDVHLECTVDYNQEHKWHLINLKSGDNSTLDVLVVKDVLLCKSEGGKTLVKGTLFHHTDGYVVSENQAEMSLWRLFHLPWFWVSFELSNRIEQLGWGKLKRLLRYHIWDPTVRLWRNISGFPNWLERWLKKEPTCPFCGGSGITHGDSLDEFTENTCIYCGGVKRLRKCFCNPWGLYPIMGKRYRDRENCPNHCGDWNLPTYAHVGWTRIMPKIM